MSVARKKRKEPPRETENIFRSLSGEYVPAVVVFCLFFGCALILVPGKEPLLDFLDVASAALGQINTFLVRLAPLGLFALMTARKASPRLALHSLVTWTVMAAGTVVGFARGGAPERAPAREAA